MEIQDITDWASASRKTIELSHGFGNAKYQLKLREFVPKEGDALYEAWSDGPVLKKHWIPPFAIENMSDTAKELQRYVDSSLVQCVCKLVGFADPLIWTTYDMTIKCMFQAAVRFVHFNQLLLAADAIIESRSSSISE